MESIKQQVKLSGISQKKIAEILKIDKVHLNYMLNGKRDLLDKYKIEILNLINKVS